ncbi:MAG: ABC transporter ATP-binding protein [Firmicutes bacterium]|nr:ABC transporter ATP-binding protein [Bacillota bacterium]
MSEKPLISVTNIKTYFPIYGGVFSRQVGDVKAVDGLSFDIYEGEIFGLVGESGCGKSTVGRTILRLLDPTAGKVKFRDDILFSVEENERLSEEKMRLLRRDMQIIFQDPFASLDPRMNVSNIVSEGLIAHKLAKRSEAVEIAIDLLERCGIAGENAGKYPHEFSGGQRQRISIARALSFNPKFIVCDEPIAALDVSIQAQILTLMQELKEEFNLTYLFISHDLGVVRYFCDRIGVMYLGNFVETGTSEQLFDNPLHPYTKALLSSMPLLDSGLEMERIILKGSVPSPANPPSGCKFHTRCPFVFEKCKMEKPEMIEVEPEHWVACFLVENSSENQNEG